MNRSFEKDFEGLIGFPPFDWQKSLFHDYFLQGRIPSALDIPTGLGKTSVMAIWYLASKAGALVPRRLIYVVDRRAVVDQATIVASTLREKSKNSELRVSTLRGRYIDNREWLASPTEPSIVVGTVDMIGSRILFSGYGVSSKMRSYHAGLLGVDALVVLDEAHLALPFEKLIETIANGAEVFGPRQQEDQDIVPPLKLLSLSATGRNDELGKKHVFRLLPEHRNDRAVRKRLEAPKKLTVEELDDEPKLVPKIVERAMSLANKPLARVLIYCDRRKDAEKVKEKIDRKFKGENTKHASELLVGGRRVLEREKLSNWLKRHGFFGDAEEPPKHPTFLIATSAGEVGVDLDADHMVCDLVEWERMVQRFGRVNRRGSGNASIEVIAAPQKKKPVNQKKIEEWEKEWKERLLRLQEPLNCLRITGANTGAILDLRERPDMQKAIKEATTPSLLYPALTRALVDAWSLTSLDKHTKHTGRPEIQPWLRGWEDDPQPQTSVVWRRYLPVMVGEGMKATKKEVEDFFEAAPPHASEKLETETYRVFDWFIERAKNIARNQSQDEKVVAYILSPSMDLRSELNMKKLLECVQNGDRKAKEKLKEYLAGATVIVDKSFGGLSSYGMLDSKVSTCSQVVDDADQEWLPQQSPAPPVIRFRVRSVTVEESQPGENWRERMRFEVERTQEGEVTRWLLVEKWRDDVETENDRSNGRLQELAEHQEWTESKVRALANTIVLPDCYIDMLAVAARLHDEGKRHPLWQRSVKAPSNGKIYAKTNRPMNTKLLRGYRHEFGSLGFVRDDVQFQALPPDLKELALHLVAAHHGRARPVISTSGGDFPPSVLEKPACEIALSFARLQKRWGPWGLAWWETLLRAADHQSSRDNDSHGKDFNRTVSEGQDTCREGV